MLIYSYFTMDNRVAQVEIIVYKIIKKQPLFLLVKRSPEKGDFWQPITGGANENENLIDAAKRELLEETGIKEYKKFLSGVYYFEFDTENYGRLKEYVYGVEVDKDVDAELSHEHTEKKWCTIDEALQLLKFDTNKEAFKKLFNQLMIKKLILFYENKSFNFSRL